jgi:hypothetical protein
MPMRFHLPPGGDVPPHVAARRLWLSLEEFERKLPELLADGFPGPYRVTGNYDLDAIEAWRKSRYPQQFPQTLTLVSRARDAKDVVHERLARARGG